MKTERNVIKTLKDGTEVIEECLGHYVPKINRCVNCIPDYDRTKEINNYTCPSFRAWHNYIFFK